MVGHKAPFGDEESDLLDRFERMWFEAHLNRAMQTRSFSLSSKPESAPLVSMAPTTHQQRQRKQRRRSGPGFHRILKKLINPILGFNSKTSNHGSIRRVHDPPQHPLTLKCVYVVSHLSFKFFLFPVMAPQFLVPSQVSQSPLRSATSNSPLFFNFHITSNSDGHSFTIRAGRQNTLKYGLTLDEISCSHTESDMKDVLAGSLVNRIRFLSSNSKNRKIGLDEAERVLNSMLENGFRPDVETLTILINSLCKRGRTKKALEIFNLMDRIGTKPTVQTYNCLLKGLCYVGKVEEAYEMLMNMKKMKIPLKPDIYSYTTVMDGLCKVGRSDEARELLNEAEELMGLKPNVITFNTLFQGYSREGRPLEGISVLKLMKKKNCVPDYISYATLLHGLLKWNEIREALKIYKEMERLGFEVDVRMMGTLVRRLCRESRKEKGMLEDARQVFEKMTKRDSIVIDQRTHELVIQALCARGRTEEAVSTLVLMDEKGRIPSGLCFDVLIKELNAQGRLFGHSNLFGYAMKRGVVEVNSSM